MSASENEGYPAELLEVPTPLVALLGEVPLHAALISCVEAVNRETQPVPTLRFTSLPREHSFPKKKDTRDRMGSTTKRYESLVAQGVLKTAWLHKHHHILPAVAVSLFRFSHKFGAAEWDVETTKVSDTVDKLRRELGAREGAIMVLLMEDDSDSPLHDASVVEERLATLRRRCDLDSKSVVLLRHSELAASAPSLRKLELLLRTLAFDYYQVQAKRVKRNRKHVAKQSLALLARHSFKVAHFCEFRRQTDKMLKHYAAAYSIVLELLNSRDAQRTLGIEQIRGVADTLNYKLCSHLMAALQTKEAVAQFQTHTRAFLAAGYQNALNDSGGECRHWHWFARQYMVFAQLLEQLHLRGGAAVSHHALGGMLHPGYFFGCAARYARRRRETAQALGLYKSAPGAHVAGEDATTSNGAAGEHEDDSQLVVREPHFVGAMPPVELAGAGPSANASEREQLLKTHLRAAERRGGHSAKVVALLQKTMDHYAKEPSTRKDSRDSKAASAKSDSSQRRQRLLAYLRLQLAEEYEAFGEYEKAKKELIVARKVYMRDGWAVLLKHVLQLTRRCARKLGDARAFVDFSMQLLSPLLYSAGANGGASSSNGGGEGGVTAAAAAATAAGAAGAAVAGAGDATTPYAERCSVLAELQQVLAASDASSLCRALGCDPSLKSELLPASIDVECSGQRLALVSCSMRFDTATGTHAQSVGACLSVRHAFPSALRFTRIDVCFTDDRYDHTFIDRAAPGAQQASIGLKTSRGLKEVVHKDMLVHPSGSEAGGCGSDATSKEFDFSLALQAGGDAMLQCKRVLLHLIAGGDTSCGADASRTGSALCFVIDANRAGSVCHHKLVGGFGDLAASATPSSSWGEAAATGAVHKMPTEAVEDEQDAVENTPVPLTELRIEAPRAQMGLSMALDGSVEGATPVQDRRALAGEYRQVQVSMESRGDAVRGARLALKRASSSQGAQKWGEGENAGDDADAGDFFWLAPHKPAVTGGDIALPDMEAESSSKFTFFVRFDEPATTTIMAIVSYTTGTGSSVSAECFTEIQAVAPFRSDFRFLPLNPHPLYASAGSGASGAGASGGADRRISLSVGEPVLVQPELRLDCAQGLRLVSLAFEPSAEDACQLLHTEAQLDDEESDDGLCGVLREKDDCFCCCLQLTPLRCGRFSLGSLKVQWHRLDSAQDEASLVTTSIPVVPVSVQMAAITMMLSMPAQAVVGEPLHLEWCIKNNTAVLQSVHISAQPSSDYLFGGVLQRSVDVQPYETQRAGYLVLPVKAGHLPLPIFSITSQQEQLQLLAEEDNHEIFVVPRSGSSNGS